MATPTRPTTLVVINGSEHLDGNTAEMLAHAGVGYLRFARPLTDRVAGVPAENERVLQ